MAQANETTFCDLSPSVQLAFLHFRLLVERHGEKACRRHGVGFMRKDFGRDDPEPVVPINDAMPPNVVSLAEAQKARSRKRLQKAGIPVSAQNYNDTPQAKALQEWRKALAFLCKECGGCKWADRPA